MLPIAFREAGVTTDNATSAPDGSDEPQVIAGIGLPEYLAVALHGLPRKLKAELAEIAKAGPDVQQIRMAAALQLGAIIEWLQHDPEIRESNDLQPLYRLFGALLDLCAGGRPLFLFEVARPDGVNTKPKIAAAHFPQGILVVAYMALERVKWKPVAIRKWLDDELRHRDLYEQVCGEDIQGWHNQHTAPRGRLAPTVVATIKDYQAELVNLHEEAEAQAFARKCLDTVRGLGLERIRLRQPQTS
jgi:hypothetical protein